MAERVIAGKYSLRREIGRGGMGLIWECFDEQLQRRVALKLMTPDNISSAMSRLRFEREARAIAQLRNEHVILVYDYGIDDGCPYIVMELLEGEDLESRMRRQERLSVPATLTLLKQIARGLEAAHAVGIVHRDLKPANIFIARGETEAVKLLDFGVVWTLSEAADGSAASPGVLVGTPAYMSPEQMRGTTPNHQSDLWSLGIIAYRALTGVLPFAGETLGELMVSVCADTLRPPSTLVADLHPDVDRFFERALAKSPKQRFQTAHELIAAFTALTTAGERGPSKILVVDDEPDMPLLIKQRFRQQIRASTYEFVFAGGGESGLDQLRRHPDIDVILADINMPVMDGLTFLGRVGEVNSMARTIIVSAYGDMNNIRGAMNRGAFDFVTKPINFHDLEVTIDKTLKHVTELRKNAQSSDENSILRRFVSPALVERLKTVGPADTIASDELEATVVFVEICRFAEVVRQSPSGAAVRLLNANFEVIIPELSARGGVVDKLLGGAALAVFQGDEHLSRALDGCLGVRTQMDALARRAGAQSPYAQGVAVGVSVGRLVSGVIGSKALGRLDYTIVGEAVSSAAELLRSASPGQIVVDARVRQAAPRAFVFAPRDAEARTNAWALVDRAAGLPLPMDETLPDARHLQSVR
jgi:eukaryotic-like serine/threonine-protein kinase